MEYLEKHDAASCFPELPAETPDCLREHRSNVHCSFDGGAAQKGGCLITGIQRF